MATNNFKAFALDPNANVMSQADWEALPALLSGFTAGKAASAQVNKAIRQATTIAALVGQFIANAGEDALDNGDVSGLVSKFTDAIIGNIGFDVSKAQTGWELDPTGMLTQWGIGSNATAGKVNITFPTAFPERITSIKLTPIIPNPSGVDSVSVDSSTNTGMVVNRRAFQSGSSVNSTWSFYWEVKGY